MRHWELSRPRPRFNGVPHEAKIADREQAECENVRSGLLLEPTGSGLAAMFQTALRPMLYSQQVPGHQPKAPDPLAGAIVTNNKLPGPAQQNQHQSCRVAVHREQQIRDRVQSDPVVERNVRIASTAG